MRKLVEEGQEVSLYETRVGRYGRFFSVVGNRSDAGVAYATEERARAAFRESEVRSYHEAVSNSGEGESLTPPSGLVPEGEDE